MALQRAAGEGRWISGPTASHVFQLRQESQESDWASIYVNVESDQDRQFVSSIKGPFHQFYMYVSTFMSMSMSMPLKADE